ncbi:hypothetical protein T07_9147 [Trichinella nelsoni]|uniref:Uncharacterized protein n=1 Tax=Trichinella nelsoni TaxID=6336 RepID=A0A0V0SK20_9BILA|nr:hypothetical protein T07_9147 [Trichinella nelsoni]
MEPNKKYFIFSAEWNETSAEWLLELKCRTTVSSTDFGFCFSNFSFLFSNFSIFLKNITKGRYASTTGEC